MHRLEVGVRLHRVEVLAADHPERRLGELPRDLRPTGRSTRAGRPRRAARRRRARRWPRRSGPRRSAAAALRVVVEGGQVVVDEREVVHELERERGRHHLLRRGAEGLADGERDHRPDPLPAHLDERVARRVALAVQVRPQLELLERVLDHRLQLVSAVHRAPAAPGRSRRSAPSRRRRTSEQLDGVLERRARLQLLAQDVQPGDLVLQVHAASRAIRPRMPFTSRPASSDAYFFASVTASSIATSSGTVPSCSSWTPMRRMLRSSVPSCFAGQSPRPPSIRASSSSARPETASARPRANSSISPS